MKPEYNSPEEYLSALPEDKRASLELLRKVILDNLPEGFIETISYGMIGYVVPHSIYPGGYHTDPKQPLPFINIAYQKHHISLYHFGLYADKDLLDWFISKYSGYQGKKPDMGKSCIRFSKADDIPLELVGELLRKITPEKWIKIYEDSIKRR